jgi:type VI secretion system protein ImpM
VHSSGQILPGWYGKMPSLGDFSQRGLPTSFVSQWDHWLAQCMLASRTALGDAWLETYLTSPIWRFYLLSGVIGEPIWAGILMPSVDRVGRYFPLTLAAAIPAIGVDLRFEHAANWFADLEQQAIATLEQGLNPDELASRLHHCPFPMRVDELAEQAESLAASLLFARPCSLSLPSLDAVPALQTSAARRLLLKQGAGMSLWWSQPSPGHPSLLLCHRGLPPAEGFIGMLNPKP